MTWVQIDEYEFANLDTATGIRFDENNNLRIWFACGSEKKESTTQPDRTVQSDYVPRVIAVMQALCRRTQETLGIAAPTAHDPVDESWQPGTWMPSKP